MQQGAELGTLTSFEALHGLGDDHPHSPYTDGDSLFDASGYQLTAFGPFASDNPIDVYEFTWEAHASGTVVFQTFTEFAWIWAGEDKDSAESIEAFDVTEAAFSWTVVPAPASVALIAPALLARRRRRST